VRTRRIHLRRRYHHATRNSVLLLSGSRRVVEEMKPPFVHRENDEKRGRNWLPEVFGFFFFLNRDQSYLSCFAKSACVRSLAATSKMCAARARVCVCVNELFCSFGGLSDIKGDVYLGDVSHIWRRSSNK